jgi:HEAT repeat protein
MSTQNLAISGPPKNRAANNKMLKAFSDEADRLIQSDPDAGFRACGPLLEQICRDGVFIELINDELRRLLQEPQYLLGTSSSEHMTVWRSPFFTLSLRYLITPQRKDRLFGQACNQIIAPVNQRAVKLSCYHQPRPWPNDVFDRSRGLVFKGEKTLNFAESIYFAACEDIFLIQSESDEDTPPLLAIFVSPEKFPVRWEYDSVTLDPVRATAVDNSASRLEFVVSLLSTMGDRSSLPALERLLVHPAHFVRWATLQAIFRLDRVRGIAGLRNALSDPHEHVRNAAARSLTKILAKTAQDTESSPIREVA